MLNFRNGYKNWKMQIWDSGAIRRDLLSDPAEIIFPRCNESGMIEEMTPETITNKTIGGTRQNILMGFYITFIFHYDRFTAPKVLDNLKIIYDGWIEKQKLFPEMELILFPRLDILDRYFSVFPSEETIRLAIMKGGQKARGNKGVVLKFHTVDYIRNFPVSDPNNRSIGLLNLTTI